MATELNRSKSLDYYNLPQTAQDRSKVTKKKTETEEKAKAAFLGTTAAIISLLALPIILCVALILSAALLIFSPDFFFYPMLVGIVASTAFLGKLALQNLTQFYQKEVIHRWENSTQI